VKEKIYTSDEILDADDLYEIQEAISNGEEIKYRMTEDELEWLSFVTNKYCIASYIWSNLEDDIVTIDLTVSEAMEADCNGLGKAVCLSDDTALQKILFWIYIEPEESEEE